MAYPSPFLIHTNPDGTQVPRSEDETTRRVIPPGTPLTPVNACDDFTALQLGLYAVLSKLTFTSVRRADLLRCEGTPANRKFQFQRVYLDWPDPEVEQRANDVSACILSPAEVELQLTGPISGQQIMEDTLDMFCPGTVLRRLGETNATLEVVIWAHDKDDRSAVRRGLIDAFLAEPGDERSGRRVVVPQYYGRPARYDLSGISYGDSPETAQQGTWPLSAKFNADIDLVTLVTAPGPLQQEQTRVVVDPAP